MNVDFSGIIFGSYFALYNLDRGLQFNSLMLLTIAFNLLQEAQLTTKIDFNKQEESVA